MKITKSDVIWNYLATFFKIASSALLLPVILTKMPSEEVGIWSIYSSIASLVFLLDFGFNSSFTRNITYIFSGVSTLKQTGYEKLTLTEKDIKVDYSLLKGTLSAMRWFYSRVALVLIIILLTLGTFYLSIVLKNYNGDKTLIYVSWVLFCIINTYNLYTLYYDALLQGKGLIKISKQIIIASQLLYILIATIAVSMGYGIISLVLAQLIAIIITRIISNKVFFTKTLRGHLENTESVDRKKIINAIYPNAVKYGVTSLGGFMIQKSAIFIGSMYLSLPVIASFSITKQLLDITIALSNISLSTYLPEITRLRVQNDSNKIKMIYLRGSLIAGLVFIVGSIFIVVVGPILLKLIHSKTSLLPLSSLITISISAAIGLNAGIAGAVISTKNEIPFAKPSIYSGIATIVLLYTFLNYTSLGVLGMALAPGVVDLAYQGWKWPKEVIKDLRITFKDFKKLLSSIRISLTTQN